MVLYIVTPFLYLAGNMKGYIAINMFRSVLKKY